MTAITSWLEELFRAIPLTILEVWGGFGLVVGLALAICAFGGFTFRLGTGWGFGRERHAWDAKAILSISITFVLVVVTGYLGSFVVLVPGAQTLESLKDLVVFVCILLFGYPALIAVPFAYGLSDLLEGVPPEFILDWLPGYFINPACFWVAYQLFGRNPDFRRARTWGKYLVFVLIFMSIEPVLWGYICSDDFTPEMSYRGITPALVFTTSITWLLAPPAMLVALPLARKLNLFWAEIPDHVRERALGANQWRRMMGRVGEPADADRAGHGVPLRMFLLTPFIAFVLVMVALTATVTLKSAERETTALAMRLQHQLAQNIQHRLDDYLASGPATGEAARAQELGRLLASLASAIDGRAFILERSGRVVASSVVDGDPVVTGALTRLRQLPGGLAVLTTTQLQFNYVTPRPLGRETWLVHALAYQHRGGGDIDWILATVMPERTYLAGVQTGRSRSAMVFAIALLLSLGIAAMLAAIVAEPLRRLSRAAHGVAGGALDQHVPVSRLSELGTLARAFNDMAAQLKASFGELVAEVDKRKQHERELEDSEARVRASENRVQIAVNAAKLGVWDWEVEHDRLIWDDSMYRLYGVRREDFSGAFEAWTKCLVPEDLVEANRDVQAALCGERAFASEFRVRWPDGSIHVIKGVAQTIRADDGHPIRMVGVNWDVTEQLRAEQELRQHRDHLEELVEERTAALSVAVGQAEAANRAKSAFLANMSHEIRTPMNAILGYAQLLQRDGTLGEAQRRRLEAIHISGEHLLTIINDVLEMSKIEAGRTTIVAQPFDLRALLGGVNAMFGGLLDPGRIALSFELDDDFPDVVEADANKVRQVIINLLSNAAKFTRNGHIRVRASCDRLSPGRLQIVVSVADTGSGIATDDLSRIFDAFEQLDSGAQVGGSGLGLAISRSFARLMQGDLTVVSEPGTGSTFTFSFEARVPTGAPAARERHEPSTVASPGETAGAIRDVSSLSVLLDGVPADLIARLRTAAMEARAPHLDRLAHEVAHHSTAAADRIRALAARFDYDLLLEALPRAPE